MVMTDGKHHEARVVKELAFPLKPDSTVSVDRGSLDFKWLYSFTLKGVWFVACAKKNFKYELVPDSIKSPKEEAFFGVILCVW